MRLPVADDLLVSGDYMATLQPLSSFHGPNVAERTLTCQHNEMKNTRDPSKDSLRVTFHIILRQTRHALLIPSVGALAGHSFGIS